MAVKFLNFVNDQNEYWPITIEIEVLRGMPEFKVIGLSDRSIREVHERARAAIKNNGYKFPIHRKIINLSPAHIPKQGTHLDLSIILGLLIRSGQIIYSPNPNAIFLGEVTLNGEIKSVPNINGILEAAKNKNVKQAFIPKANLKETYIEGIDLIPVENLKELINTLHSPAPAKQKTKTFEPVFPTFDDIINQNEAKKALAIALAGNHKALLIGSPGCGKSVLAQSAQNLILNRPFISVNGDITLTDLKTKYPQSKHGLIVFNELNELNRKSLDHMKVILESSPDHTIIATVNPCKCGYHQDPYKVCYCTPYNLKLFKQKLSATLLDRFDIAIIIIAEPLVDKPTHELEETKRHINLVKKARRTNRHKSLKQLLPALDSKSKNLISVIEKKYSISNRRLEKLLQLAQTISTINNKPNITEEHIAESFNLQKFLITHEWTKNN
jgi:magnesium chelatase family protein